MLARFESLLNKFFGDVFEYGISSKLLALLRVAFGFSTIFYAVSYFLAVDLIWFSEIENIWIFRLLAGSWILCGVFIVIGMFSQVASLINFLLTAFLVANNPIMYTVEELFYHQMALWFLFLPMDDALSLRNVLFKRKDKLVSANWPAFFIGLVVSMYLFTAGFNKSIDPLWRNGYGLYYTLLLPWIKGSYYNFLLDYKWLMLLLNYIAMVFQLSSLPLFLWRKTRYIAVVMMLFFSVLLTFLFNGLSFLGTFGIILMLPAFLNNHKTTYLTKLKKTKFEINYGLRFRRAVLGSIALILFHFVTILPTVFNKSYPKVFPPMKTNVTAEAKEGPYPILKKFEVVRNHYLGFIFNPLDKLSWFTYHVTDFALFNIQHTIGIYEFKIKIHYEDGEIEEPIVVYENDKSPGPDLGFFSGLWYETQMYAVTLFSANILSGTEPSEKVMSKIHGLLSHWYKNRKYKEKVVKKVVVYSSPLQTPDGYSGNDRIVSIQPWTPIYCWLPETDEYLYLEKPQKFNLNIEFEKGLKLYLD